MNFGDILNQWDSNQKAEKAKAREKSKVPQVSHKMANAPTAEEKAARKRAKLASEGRLYEIQMEEDSKKQINPMELWLRRYGVTDKDKAADEYNERAKMESREYLRTMRPEARIDLHGLTRDEAWSRLNSFVSDCIRRGLKKILIIHGKGNHSNGSDPVLGPMVKTFIEQHKNLGTSGHPDRAMGGSGATWVIIK
ncbi:Smr/MutS family protein [Treponema sp.]|uniref:Smr/MutS family protein n=1 Tax=Treponema sp. TaxID=166 RepID=UPI0025F27429|nr:Smr/MutS family protein [Treponema sp.]MBQ7538729.1 Smr/MutS family protein [Treponema sp.]MBR4322089.1 Smr/MutS family protein [Treponema sp.]